MTKDPKISNIQIRGLMTSSIIGVGTLSLPNQLVSIIGKDGWISIILSGVLTIPIIWIINQIFLNNPGKDYFQIVKSTLGSTLFYLFMIILSVYFIIFLGSITRNLGQLVNAFLLPNTPIEIIILTFILACSYIAIYEIDIIARAGYSIYPIIIITIFILIVTCIPTAEFTGILPVFQSDITQLPKSIGTNFFSFAGFEMLLFALPYAEDNKKTFKSSLLAILIVTISYLGIFFMTLANFSSKQIKSQIYPVLMLAKQVDLPGYFLQNLDGLFMAIWILVVFASMAPTYFAMGKVLSKTFKTKDHKYFIWGLIPVIYFLALIPENVAELFIIQERYLNILGFISIVITPVLVFIVGTIRKRFK